MLHAAGKSLVPLKLGDRRRRVIKEIRHGGCAVDTHKVNAHKRGCQCLRNLWARHNWRHDAAAASRVGWRRKFAAKCSCAAQIVLSVCSMTRLSSQRDEEAILANAEKRRHQKK